MKGKALPILLTGLWALVGPGAFVASVLTAIWTESNKWAQTAALIAIMGLISGAILACAWGGVWYRYWEE